MGAGGVEPVSRVDRPGRVVLEVVDRDGDGGRPGVFPISGWCRAAWPRSWRVGCCCGRVGREVFQTAILKAGYVRAASD